MKHKELRSLNRELIRTLSAELGIPEEKVPHVVALLKEALSEEVKRDAMQGVARRTLVAMGLGGLLTAAMASPAAARLTLTDSYIDLDGEKFYPSSVAPYSAIVYKDENVVKAEDWWGKEIARGEAGVDDAEVIQKALDSLTPNRSWKERVVLIGEFLLNEPIDLGDKSNIIIEGSALLKPNGVKAITIGGANGQKYSENIVIRDLHIVGDENVEGTEGIYVGYSSNILIENVSISGVYGRAIAILWASDPEAPVPQNVTVRDCKIITTRSGNTLEAILIGGIGCAVENCYIESNGNVDYGIFVYDTTHFRSKNCRIVGNIIKSFNTVGIHVSCVDNTIVADNTIECNGYCGRAGIAVSSNGEARSIDGGVLDWGDVIIKNNKITGAKGHGIRVRYFGHTIKIVDNIIQECNGCGIIIQNDGHDIRDVVIRGNTLRNNLQDTSTPNDPKIDAPTKHSSIVIFATDKNFYDVFIEDNIINEPNADYAIGAGYYNSETFVRNFVLRLSKEYTPASMRLPLTMLKARIESSEGYVTENSGTATFSGDGSTTQFKIAHGLVSTPSKVLVTPLSADAAGDFYVTADDTYIYINYSSAPASGTDNVKVSWYAEV